MQKQIDPIVPFLQLLSSSDLDVSDRASKYLIMESTVSPQIINQSVLDIQLFIQSLCVSRKPRWGVVSAISLALANAGSLDPQQIQPSVLINICRCVTQSYFSAADESSYAPFLTPLVQTVQTALIRRKILPDVMVQLAEHAAVGVLQNASLVPAVIKAWPSAVESMQSLLEASKISDAAKLASPISSPDNNAVLCFMTLWATVLPRFLEAKRAEVVQALAPQISKILEFVEQDKYPFSSLANYLLDCIKSSSDERDVLAKNGAAKRDAWFKVLNEFVSNALKKTDTNETAQPAELVSRDVKVVKPPLKGISVELFERKIDGKKKKVIPKRTHYVSYSPEAEILSWSPSLEMKSMECVHKSQIESIVSQPEENSLIISAKKKEYQFKFNSEHFLQQIFSNLTQM